ncbi:MAG: Na+/H+ antiporter NhaA [Chryseobacterium taeanense]
MAPHIDARMLGGIGFTMSIFITILAFKDPEIIVFSKIAILIASVLSEIFGFIYLKYILEKKKV